MSLKEDFYEEHYRVSAKWRSTEIQTAQMAEEIIQLKNSIAQKDEEIHHLKDLLDKVCFIATSACSDVEQLIKTTQEELSETLRPVSAYSQASKKINKAVKELTVDTTIHNKTEPVKAVGTKAMGSERRPSIHEDMRRKIASKAAKLAGNLMRPRWSHNNEEIVKPTPTPTPLVHDES